LNSIDLNQAEILNVSKRGDGRQRIMKVPYGESFIILKCFGLKRTRLRAFFREFGSLAVVKKTSITARGRHDTELEVITLWKQEGFDVPDVYSPPKLPDDFPPCIAMEWIPGPTVAEVLQDKNVSLAAKKEIIARYAPVWGKRHARALELSEPGLLQENPTLSHVFSSGDRLVHFDFEIVFTRKKDLERLIRREIVGIIHSMAKTGGDDFKSLLDTLLQNYPDLSHIRQTARELSRYGTVPMLGWTAELHRLTRNRKRYRKRIGFVDILNNALQKLP